MEFIPIKKFADKKKKNRKIDDIADESEPPRKQFKKEIHAKPSSTKVKPKPQGKKVKNKYKERLVEKQKEKSKKKKLKQESVDVEKRKVDDDDEKEENEIVNKTADEDVEDQDIDESGEEDGTEEVEEEEEDENDDDDDEEKLKKQISKRRKKLDDKMKNRLYIKLKNKIHSEAQIKALHENIKGVLFPRKKNSCWCWAIFASEERANEALKKLKKNKEIIATKPLPREQVEKRIKEKKSDILRRNKARKKLESMWL